MSVKINNNSLRAAYNRAVDESIKYYKEENKSLKDKIVEFAYKLRRKDMPAIDIDIKKWPILSGFICPNCYKSILYNQMSFFCPLCDNNFDFSHNVYFHERDDFQLISTKQAKILFDCCEYCHGKIQYVKCYHCDKPIDLFAHYNWEELEAKRYE